MKFSLEKIIKAITVDAYNLKDENGEIDSKKSRKIAAYAILTQH